MPWSELLSAEQTCEQKLQTLTDAINYELNTIMPERSIKVHETDRPWISVQLKYLIARRQPTLVSGNRTLYKILRNKVNRERKRCRIRPIMQAKLEIFTTPILVIGGVR